MSIVGTLGDDDAKLFDHKINIGKHIRDIHVIAAFNDRNC
jgi:hypothetical protein